MNNNTTSIHNFVKAQSKDNLPFYAYDKSIIRKRAKELKEAFPEFEILYSVKANPNDEIIETINSEQIGIDAASVNEVYKANCANINKEHIFYSAPGKSLKEIKTVFDKCIIIADSINELKIINEYATSQKQITEIGIRLNVISSYEIQAFEVMSGHEAYFGISLVDLGKSMNIIKSFNNISIIGVHAYMGSQILDWNQIVSNFDNICNEIYELERLLKIDLAFVNFGGGFGVPYNFGDKKLALNLIVSELKKLSNLSRLKSKRLLIESGRFITAESGYFVTEILDIKDFSERRKIIIRGGMNTFFRPIFTKQQHKIEVLNSKTEKILCDIHGNSCTPLDTIAKGIMVNECDIGDLIIFHNAGAYGYSMSLNQFISPEPTKEYFFND